MESLLRLSGLISEGENGEMDLAALEKQLATKSAGTGPSAKQSPDAPQLATRASSVESDDDGPSIQNGAQTSPQTSRRPSRTQEDGRDEVEALSDMMCSLVTNNCGETRFIGMANSGYASSSVC